MLPTVYQQQPHIPADRVVILDSEHDLKISTIDCGILFILARWSGASHVAFRALANALDRIGHLGALSLYIADTDDPATEKIIVDLGDIPGGYGETYWIRDGKVVSRLAGYKEDKVEEIVLATKRLLE